MAKRIKKPPVDSTQRQKWLQRYDSGESPSEIAGSDSYDVRTVRKHIELASQERERNEARSAVLRNALEQHYADLCTFAEKLKSQVNNPTDTTESLKEERMWSALREHMPRSALWKNLDKRTKLLHELISAERDLKNSIEEQIKARSKQKITTSPQEVGFNSRTIDAISTNAHLVALGQQEILGYADFELKAEGEEFTIIELANFLIGKSPNAQVQEILTLVRSLLDEVTTWQEYDDMSRLLAELNRVNRILRDELAIITLRRVVPGRCKYCPI